MCSLIQKWPTVTVSHQCLGLLSHGDTLKPCQRKMLMKHLTVSFFVASIMSNSQGLEVRAPCKVCYKQSSLILSLYRSLLFLHVSNSLFLINSFTVSNVLSLLPVHLLSSLCSPLSMYFIWLCRSVCVCVSLSRSQRKLSPVVDLSH